MKAAYKWHRRVGWLLAPFLALSACSGMVLLWSQPLPAAPNSPAELQAWLPALDAGLSELHRRHPAAEADVVDLPRGPDDLIRVHLRSPRPEETGWVAIDPNKQAVPQLQPDSRDVRALILGLHEHLLLDGAGPWLLRAVALAALVLLGMGLRVWWRVRRLPARSSWRLWHRRVGPVALLPVGMMLTTGFLLRTPELPRAVLAGAPGPAVAAAVSLAVPVAGIQAPASAGQVLAAAAAALPEARPTRLYAARDGVLRVRLRVDEWNPFGLNYVYVGASDARVLRVVRTHEQPLAVRYLNVVYPLHAAWLPGHAGPVVSTVMRGLWTLFALSMIVMTISGAAQALRRNP
jgi:uncharacterized iron-regulated membrane protein